MSVIQRVHCIIVHVCMHAYMHYIVTLIIRQSLYINSALLCFYSKLRRCCPGELEGGSLQCASSTTLNFNGEDVKVLIHQTTSGTETNIFL